MSRDAPHWVTLLDAGNLTPQQAGKAIDELGAEKVVPDLLGHRHEIDDADGIVEIELVEALEEGGCTAVVVARFADADPQVTYLDGEMGQTASSADWWGEPVVSQRALDETLRLLASDPAVAAFHLARIAKRPWQQQQLAICEASGFEASALPGHSR